MAKSKSKSKSGAKLSLNRSQISKAGLITAALVAGVFFAVREFMPHLIWRLGFDLFSFWLLLAGLATVIVSAGAHEALGKNGLLRGIGGGVLLGLVGLALMFSNGYRASSTVADGVLEEAGKRPAFVDRMPYTQGQRAVTRALESEVGDISDVTYVGDRWCGFLEQKQTVFRNEVTSVACVLSDGSSQMAKFNVPAPAHRDGILRSSTLIAAQRQTNGAVPANDSVYAYIDESGEPVLVIPLIERIGGSAGYKAPAGVVTVDTNGVLNYRDSVTAGEIPGPVLAIQVAEDIRTSLNSRFGYRAHIQNRRSPMTLDSTESYGPVVSVDEESGESVNRFNSSEFLLIDLEGRSKYVTPLTPLGASDNVSAYLVVDADSMNRGQLPKAVLYRLDETEAGPGAVSERVQSLYDADIDWSIDAGTLLTEVTPGAEGRLVATAINGQLATYRFDIEAELTTNNAVGEVCVRAGRSTSVLRCDNADDPPASVGALRGISGSRSGTGDPSGERPEGIEGFTTEELLEELLRRELEGS